MTMTSDQRNRPADALLICEHRAPAAAPPSTAHRAPAAVVMIMAALAALTAMPAAAGMIPVTIEVPLTPKVDVSGYRDLMVASFVASREARLDLEEETIHYLRKLFTRSSDLDVVPEEPPTLPTHLPEPMIFEQKDYWKDMGNRFGCDLIFTGTVSFSNEDRSGYEQIHIQNPYTGRFSDPRSAYHNSSRTVFREKTGFYLNMKVFVIDAVSGEQLYTDKFYQEIVYDGSGPDDLSVFFLMMDRLAPQIKGIMSEQKIRVTRYLLE